MNYCQAMVLHNWLSNKISEWFSPGGRLFFASGPLNRKQKEKSTSVSSVTRATVEGAGVKLLLRSEKEPEISIEPIVISSNRVYNISNYDDIGWKDIHDIFNAVVAKYRLGR